MEEPEYEYRGLIASSWDLLRGDTTHWGDRRRYRELIERYGQPALDVGCGTGRLLLDYLRAGIDIDGVDNSPEMLARCREKAGRLGLHPVLYQQSMEALALPRRYRTILVPSSSFQLVTDSDAAAAAMRRFLVHLEPGGALAMSFMPLWQAGDPLETGWGGGGRAGPARGRRGGAALGPRPVRAGPAARAHRRPLRGGPRRRGGRGGDSPALARDPLVHARPGARPLRRGGLRRRAALPRVERDAGRGGRRPRRGGRDEGGARLTRCSPKPLPWEFFNRLAHSENRSSLSSV
jgi:SAM-dependent methyltransferase